MLQEKEMEKREVSMLEMVLIIARDNINRWLSTRLEAGRKIDPTSADIEVTSWHGPLHDPYNFSEDLESGPIARFYFVRSADSDGWVFFGDLPKKTRAKLWQRVDANEFSEQPQEAPPGFDDAIPF